MTTHQVMQFIKQILNLKAHPFLHILIYYKCIFILRYNFFEHLKNIHREYIQVSKSQELLRFNVEASMDSACVSGGNSKPTENCTMDQSTTMQQILQSAQSLSSSISRIEERLESYGTALTAKIQNVEDKLDAELSKQYNIQETLQRH